MLRPHRPLPPLEVETAYEAADFERVEYVGVGEREGAATLRLHLKNGTTIDLPCNADQLRTLLFVLCDAVGTDAIGRLESRNWI